MTIIIHNYTHGEEIPDANEDRRYTYEELDGAVFLYSDDITGAVTFKLKSYMRATIQSIDLDWVTPYEDSTLRTTSLITEGN